MGHNGGIYRNQECDGCEGEEYELPIYENAYLMQCPYVSGQVANTQAI